MKVKIRAPYFEIGVKNYIYGDDVLELAMAADKLAEKYDIDILFIAPCVEIRRLAENTKNLILLAPYMDTLRPGRGMADILPEALKAAGAEDEKLAAAIEAQIQSTEGNPLVYTVERVLKTNISGNSILYYQNKAKYCTKTYTFKIMANGVKKNVTIALKCYTGSEEKYTNQSSDQHSGGGTL